MSAALQEGDIDAAATAYVAHFRAKLAFAGRDHRPTKAAQIEQNFQFEADIEMEFWDTVTIAKAPDGARLALVPQDVLLKPQRTIGDKAPHTTYSPTGEPTQALRRKDGYDQMHGRGWTRRSGHRLIPAPAVTYTGEVKLPVMITVTLVPLMAGQELADMPQITSETFGGRTTWTLPIIDGTLRFIASSERCTVLQR